MNTATDPMNCDYCYLVFLERSANSLGYTLRPVEPIETNLKPEYHEYFRTLSSQLDQMIAQKEWTKLLEIDQLPYETTLRAITEDIGKLFTVGFEPKSPEGTNKVISLMRGIKNLLSLLNSIG